MKTKPEGWNIVLVGFWNRAIFTPEWVNKLLFKGTTVETMLSIMPHMPIIYRHDKVTIEVSTPNLIFRPRRLDDECLIVAEKMAHTVLEKLQDTPLLAVGINHMFVENDPRPDLVNLFRFSDEKQIRETEWTTMQHRIVRTLERKDEELNLILEYKNQSLTIEFNYHTETSDNEKCRKALNDRVILLRDETLQLLRQVYRLELSDEEQSNE